MSNIVKKYQLIKPIEDDLFEHLFVQGKSVRETVKALEKKGIKTNENTVLKFKRNIAESIIENDRMEYLADYALESTKRLVVEFNDIMTYTKELLLEAKQENQKNLQLEVIKELRAQIELALKKQGQLNSNVSNTMLNIQNNIVTTSDIIEQMEKIKLSWLKDGGAILTEDNKIVFETPTPEMIDLFRKQSFSEAFNKTQVIDV